MFRPGAGDVEVGFGEMRGGRGGIDVDYYDGVGFKAFETSNRRKQDSVVILPMLQIIHDPGSSGAVNVAQGAFGANVGAEDRHLGRFELSGFEPLADDRNACVALRDGGRRHDILGFEAVGGIFAHADGLAEYLFARFRDGAGVPAIVGQQEGVA